MKTPRILAATIALLTTVDLHARNWDGDDFLTNSNVGNGLNWQLNLPPVNDGTEDMRFQPTAISFTPNFAVAWSVNSLEAWGGYTFSGQTVTIGADGLKVVGAGDATFNNQIILTADQILYVSGGAGTHQTYLNAGLDINANTVDLDIQGGSSIHTTGLYGFGKINVLGAGTWFHKSGGVDFHADVDVSYGDWVIEAGPVAQLFANSSAINVEYGTMRVERNTIFDGGLFTARSAADLTFAAGISLTLRNGTQMSVGLPEVADAALDLTDVDLTVTGTGTSLIVQNDGTLIAGGTFSILAGASVTGSESNIATGGFDVGGGGTLLVDGMGTTLTALQGASGWGSSTGTATISISNQAVASLQNVDVVSGNAAGAIVNVTVDSGANVASDRFYIGAFGPAGSSGTVTVTGAGTSWTMTSEYLSDALQVGDADGSTGTLRVEDGATFSTGTLATTTVAARGSIELDGGIFNANSNVLLSGSGALLTKTVGSQFNLAAGKTLTVQAGADVSFDGVYTTGGGHITVTTAGSTFTMQTAAFNISAGSVLTIGTGAPFGGTVTTATGGAATTVDGASSVLIAGGVFVSNGDLSLSGAGTTLTRTDVGTFMLATGKTLTVQQGADAIFTGNYTLGSSNILVSGPNSSWMQTDSGALTIGSQIVFATAAVTVQNGGTFSTGTGAVTLAATGTVNVAGGIFAVNGPLSGSGAVNFTSGTLNLGANDLSIVAGGYLGGVVSLAGGKTLLTTGTTTVQAGSLLAITGATFRTGALVNSGAFALTSGLLGITGAGGLTIGAGGPLGSTFGLGAAATLEVVNATTVAAGGAFSLGGGTLTSGSLANSGDIELASGSMSLGSALNNNVGGRIFVPGTFAFAGGITNAGQLTLQNGTSNLGGTGGITNTGLISGDGTLAKIVSNSAGSEIRVGAGKTLTFTKPVLGTGTFTGAGTTRFEGGWSPGNSPALITHSGSVVLGALNTLTLELGGTTRGTQYDALDVAGNIAFGGTLTVPLIGGFQPQFGNAFNLFDWGTTSGTFTTVTLPALATGLLWSQANLYTAGELTVGLDLVVASRTWDGGGGNNAWSTNNNWVTNVQPLNNGAASLLFAGNVRLSPGVDTPWNVAAITFDNTAGAFTINGPQGITIGAGGVTNNDTQTQTITAAITLSASESFTAAAGDLRVSSVALAGQTLALTGANDITLATASGSGTINKNNTGDLDITGALGTGGVILNANAGDTDIGASQTLSALNIANGATLTLGAIAPPPPFAAVPEPGIAALLLSALGFLGFRRSPSRR